MAYFLSGDIGGTKTLLQLSAAVERVPLLQKAYASADYAGLSDMLDEFVAEAGVSNIAAACFALAGPVSGRLVKLTNLPWEVNADELASRYGIRHVALINDFEAVGHGIAALQAADLLTLQAGAAQAGVCALCLVPAPAWGWRGYPRNRALIRCTRPKAGIWILRLQMRRSVYCCAICSIAMDMFPMSALSPAPA